VGMAVREDAVSPGAGTSIAGAGSVA